MRKRFTRHSVPTTGGTSFIVFSLPRAASSGIAISTIQPLSVSSRLSSVPSTVTPAFMPDSQSFSFLR